MKNWEKHFRNNQLDRPEPAWEAPIDLPPNVIKPLLKSLEQFQLGDGGGPAYLIARDRERFLSTPGTRPLVDLWFAEEREHSRLLGEAVKRFGGQCIESHWSFSVFCLTRKWLGVRFELTVLLLTEIVSTGYYKLLRRHCPDPAVRAMCDLILRDEAGHIAYHRDRLAIEARENGSKQAWTPLQFAVFRVLKLAAGTMLWVNHAPALKAMGATTKEFYQEIWEELSRFARQLQRDSSTHERRETIPEGENSSEPYATAMIGTPSSDAPAKG